MLEEGAAHVESLKILIAAVRGLLLFIVLTALSGALSFAVLYKWDIHYSIHESVRTEPSPLLITESTPFRMKIWKGLVLSLEP